jgi:hypothetical protein
MVEVEEFYPAKDVFLSTSFSSAGFNDLGFRHPLRIYDKPVIPEKNL